MPPLAELERLQVVLEQLVAVAVVERRSESAALAVILLTLVTVAFAPIATLHERDVVAANIRTAEDAIWWAVTTLTTVGCGDKYPVTSEGRIVAMVLMALGMSLVATMSGLFASWFMGARSLNDNAELAALRRELDEVRSTLGSSRNGRD